MERLNKIRFYAPMYLLAAGLTFGCPSMTAFAEEDTVTSETQDEENKSENNVQTQSSESYSDEVLYEETEDNYTTDDIPDESQKSDEEKAQEEAARQEEERRAQEEADKALSKEEQAIELLKGMTPEQIMAVISAINK